MLAIIVKIIFFIAISFYCSIIFILYCSQSAQHGNSEIYMMNSDGTGLLRLTRNLADDRNPIWSADGTKVYFSSNRNEKYELFELNIN